MTDRTISRQHRRTSASDLIAALGESLSAIKQEDSLTDAELGAFLGKGVDAGADYRRGFAEMPFTSFLRGCETWNGRFANDTLALIGMKLVPLNTSSVSVQSLQTKLARLMVEVSSALEDGDIDELERARMKRTLIEVGEAIDGYRGAAA
jgi:hypothetical protein